METLPVVTVLVLVLLAGALMGGRRPPLTLGVGETPTEEAKDDFFPPALILAVAAHNGVPCIWVVETSEGSLSEESLLLLLVVVVVVVLLRGVPGCSMDKGVLRNRTAVGGDMEVNTVLKDSSFVSWVPGC